MELTVYSASEKQYQPYFVRILYRIPSMSNGRFSGLFYESGYATVGLRHLEATGFSPGRPRPAKTSNMRILMNFLQDAACLTLLSRV